MQRHIATVPAKKSIPISLINPLKHREVAKRSTWRLPLFSMNNLSYLSLSCWEKCSSPLINFISLFGTCCRRSTSSIPRAEHRTLGRPYRSGVEGENNLLDLPVMLHLMQPRVCWFSGLQVQNAGSHPAFHPLGMSACSLKQKCHKTP